MVMPDHLSLAQLLDSFCLKDPGGTLARLNAHEIDTVNDLMGIDRETLLDIITKVCGIKGLTAGKIVSWVGNRGSPVIAVDSESDTEHSSPEAMIAALRAELAHLKEMSQV